MTNEVHEKKMATSQMGTELLIIDHTAYRVITSTDCLALTNSHSDDYLSYFDEILIQQNTATVSFSKVGLSVKRFMTTVVWDERGRNTHCFPSEGKKK